MSRNPRTGKVNKSGRVKIARWVSQRRKWANALGTSAMGGNNS